MTHLLCECEEGLLGCSSVQGLVLRLPEYLGEVLGQQTRQAQVGVCHSEWTTCI